ncbi:MAG: hypothetical protein MSJ26_00870 [Oscillospiraceae bacterium]|nr:hypothetical protein [Oscillospiraceae bacterium]
MKKLITAIAAAVMCLSMSAAVSADVIIEPDDSFYSSHRTEIEYPGDGRTGRQYMLTEETDVYSEPGGKKTGTLSAGKSPWIHYLYTDKNGKKWGSGFDPAGGDKLFWICLDGYEAVYDNFSFTEEHKSEIAENTEKKYNSLKADGAIYLWKYPGSEESVLMEKHPEDPGSYVSKLYTDKSGDEWGYIGYIWGESGWLYLHDPTDPSPCTEDVSAGAMMEQSIYEESTESGEYTIAAFLALGAAAGSAVLLSLVKKKTNK